MTQHQSTGVRFRSALRALAVGIGALGGATPSSAVAEPPSAAAARQPQPLVLADTSDVERLIWTASMLQRVLAERDYSTALLVGLAAREWPAGSDAATSMATLVQRAAANRAEFDACRTADAAQGTLCALERLHALVPASLAPALADEAARLVAAALRAPTPALPNLQDIALQRQDAFQGYLEERLHRFWPTARGLAGTAGAGGDGSAPAAAAAALALEPWLRERVGHGIGDGTAAILARNPTLAGLLRAHPVLGDLNAGTLTQLSREAVVGRFHAFFGTMVDSAHVAVRALGGVAAGGVFTGLPAGSDPAAWAARRSLVYLASRAVDATGAGGLPAGITALGNAAADLHRGLGDLPATLMGAGRSAAALALTGNVLGIAHGMTALLNLAGGGHATAAAEIRALRGVVDSLRVQVDGRFDHLDAAVDSVLVALGTGFDRLERAVATSGEASRREIAAVHADVTALHQRFERLEASIQGYLVAGFDRDHARTLSRCLDHRERFAPPHDQMDFATFSGCLVEFRTRGVSDARDALLTDRETPAGDDNALVAALADTSRQNVGRRLPLIARAAAARHGHPAPAAPLANPLEWAVAAEAYVRMLDEWPEHAAAVTTADLDGLIAVGRELDRWSRRLTTDDAGAPRPDLFTAAIRDHAAAAAELRAAIEAFSQRQQERRLQRIPRDSLVRAMTPASGVGPTLDTPRGLVERVPADALSAAMLGLQPLELRYTVVARDSVVRDNFRRGFLRGTRHDRHHWSLPTMLVEAVIGGSVVGGYEVRGAAIRQRTEEMAGGEASEQVRATRVHVADPAAEFLATQWPQLARGADWTARPTGTAVLAPLRAAVEGELERFAAQSLDDLLRAVCAGGAPPAGAAADADRIGDALGRLTTARTLFVAYARAGLGRSIAFDPALRELLSGPAMLPDRAALCGRLQRGERALRLLWLEDDAARAAARADAWIRNRFADPGTLPEPLAEAVSALERLEAARRIQRTRTRDGG